LEEEDGTVEEEDTPSHEAIDVTITPAHIIISLSLPLPKAQKQQQQARLLLGDCTSMSRIAGKGVITVILLSFRLGGETTLALVIDRVRVVL